MLTGRSAIHANWNDSGEPVSLHSVPVSLISSRVSLFMLRSQQWYCNGDMICT